MAAKFRIDQAILKDGRRFTKSVERATVKATKRAMRRALPTMKKSAFAEIKNEYKLSGRPKKFVDEERKLSGSNLRKLSVSVMIRNRKIPLLEFVKGSKTPRNQKGIPVNKRKTITVEIKPGNRRKLGSAFITKVRGPGFNVFRRKGEGLAVQNVPSPHFIFLRNPATIARVGRDGVTRMRHEFRSAFNFFLR